MKKILNAIIMLLGLSAAGMAQSQPCVTLKQVYEVIKDVDPAVALKGTCLKEYCYHRFEGRVYGMAWGHNVNDQRYELTNPYYMEHGSGNSTIFVYTPNVDNWILSFTDTTLLSGYLKEAQQMGFRFISSEEGKKIQREDSTFVTAYDLQWAEAPTPYNTIGILAYPEKVMIHFYILRADAHKDD